MRPPIHVRIFRDVALLAVGFAAHFCFFVEGMEDRLRDNASILAARPWPAPNLEPAPEVETEVDTEAAPPPKSRLMPPHFLPTMGLSLSDQCDVDGGRRTGPARRVVRHLVDAVMIDRDYLYALLAQMRGLARARLTARGLEFEELERGSPWETLGFANGDRVVSLGDHELSSLRAVAEAEQWLNFAQHLDVRYVRNGEFRTLHLKVAGPEPASPPRAFSVECRDGTCGVDVTIVEAQAVDEMLRAKDDNINRASFVACRSGTENYGYQLLGVRRRSLPRMLGFRTGDVILSVGGHRLESVDAGRIAFWNLGHLRKLDVLYERRGERRLNHIEVRGERRQIGCSWGQTSDIAVAPAPAQSVIIERPFLERAYRDLERLKRQARLLPALEAGKLVGFKLVGFRNGSLPDLMGFKGGDLIVSVGGRDLTSTDAGQRAYEQLKHTNALDVVFIRKGERRVLHAEIR